jgi:hypothetical protein
MIGVNKIVYGGSMSSKLIAYIAVVLVLSLVIIPSPLFADDDDLLTSRERMYRLYMVNHIATAREVVGEWKVLLDTQFRQGTVDPYPEPGSIQFPMFECLVYSHWPDSVSDISEAWNESVCVKFEELMGQALSLTDVIRKFHGGNYIEGFQDQHLKVRKMKDTLRDIESSISQIEGIIAERMDELIDLRKTTKEVETEAKEELGLGDDECFIATAAYGTPKALEINELRRFRDEYLRESSLGNEFIAFYYENSPHIADFISEHEILRTVVREGFVEPVVKIVELTENYWSK